MPLHLFAGFGVELEHVIVDAETLDVLPIADELLKAAAVEAGLPDAYVSDVEFGPIAWSNELALHVIEFKTNGPAERLAGLDALFRENVERANRLLAPLGGRLLPTAMHPWMDPHREMQLWPHEFSPVYEAFNRIFDCRGHGWANLQSCHLNLPFADDEEFGRLHAAIRLLLPILPGVAASSPFVDGTATGIQDNRLDVYRGNARRVPSVSGRVIPEAVFDQADYEREILGRMYADIAPLDPEGVLREEFLNSRGAIARFTRNAIEIRVLDVQECPRMDLAIVAAIVAVLKRLVAEEWSPLAAQQAVGIDPLERILLAAIRDADAAVVDDGEHVAHFGLTSAPVTIAELWRTLIDREIEASAEFASAWGDALQLLTERGPLSRRLLAAAGSEPSPERLREVYRELAGCVTSGEPFHDS